MSKQAIFKYNNGNGALLCSGCSKIIKIGSEFTKKEWQAARGEIKILPRYCDECKNKKYYDEKHKTNN